MLKCNDSQFYGRVAVGRTSMKCQQQMFIDYRLSTVTQWYQIAIEMQQTSGAGVHK